jgi:hypothetical protein
VSRDLTLDEKKAIVRKVGRFVGCRVSFEKHDDGGTTAYMIHPKRALLDFPLDGPVADMEGYGKLADLLPWMLGRKKPPVLLMKLERTADTWRAVMRGRARFGALTETQSDGIDDPTCRTPLFAVLAATAKLATALRERNAPWR